jgi:hypothetical protein
VNYLVDTAQLRRHVDNLESIRARFAAVTSASAAITRDDGAFGLLCSWLPGVLEGRHRRQDELIAYVRENFALAGDALTVVAAAYDDVDAGVAEAMRRAGEGLGR